SALAAIPSHQAQQLAAGERLPEFLADVVFAQRLFLEADQESPPTVFPAVASDSPPGTEADWKSALAWFLPAAEVDALPPDEFSVRNTLRTLDARLREGLRHLALPSNRLDHEEDLTKR